MPMPVISAYDFANFADDSESDDSPLKTFLRGKTVLLTGGTGALGEVYLEKLLRSNVKSIYFLAKEKKGLSIDERLQAVFSTVLFTKVKQLNPRFLERVHPVLGDLGTVGLGLSTADRESLCSNVELVIHAGSDVRLDSSLGDVTLVNVRGTREMLRLAHNMKHLQGFAYISTAFAHSQRDRIEEQFYDSPIDPDQLVHIVEHLGAESEVLDVLTDTLTKPWPNTYTFSMAVAEELLKRASHVVPITVIRPTIVLSTHEDPISGYNTSTYAINDLMVHSAFGLLRVAHARPQSRAHICCSDHVVSTTLAALHNLHVEKSLVVKKPVHVAPTVYAVTINTDELTWATVTDSVVANLVDQPIMHSIWLPRLFLMACVHQANMFISIYELLPTILMELFLVITGHKVRLLPTYRRVWSSRKQAGLLMRRDWEIVCENIGKLYEGLHKSDRAFYPCDLPNFDWSDFSYKYVLGIKRYVFKENLNNLEEAKKKQQKLRIGHVVVLFLYYASMVVVGWLAFRIFGLTCRVCSVVDALL